MSRSEKQGPNNTNSHTPTKKETVAPEGGGSSENWVSVKQVNATTSKGRALKSWKPVTRTRRTDQDTTHCSKWDSQKKCDGKRRPGLVGEKDGREGEEEKVENKQRTASSLFSTTMKTEQSHERWGEKNRQ